MIRRRKAKAPKIPKIKVKKSKPKPLIPSLIAENMRMSGDIEGEGALEVVGRIEGNIKCLSVHVKKGAIIQGDVTAENIVIEGEIIGEVKGRFVKCASTAKIIGNIVHIFLEIENGAYIDGSCRKHLLDEMRMIPYFSI